MSVDEAIELLKTMPRDARLHIIYDGEPRIPVDHIYMSKQGIVIATSANEVVYNPIFRPVDNKSKDKYWRTPQVAFNPKDEVDY